MAATRVVRSVEAAVVPWRNGGGVTREYLREGGDEFDWRLSMAEIAASGPFSTFPGVDRILVYLAGTGVRLYIAAEPERVLRTPLEWVSFAGDDDVFASPEGGPSIDLNLMWRRDRYRASVAIVNVADGDVLKRDDAAVGVGFVASGEVYLDDGDLEAADAFTWHGDLAVLGGEGTLVVFTLQPASAAG